MPSIELHFGEQDLGKYRLVKEVTSVGRDPTADIVIDNLGISRFHCRYVNRDNVFSVEDMESSNGTFVNGKRVVSHNLNEGDEVVIGKYRMVFHYHVDEGEVADQGTKAVASGAGVMPDTLKTYVMDGKAIRDQLKKLEDSQEEVGAKQVSAADYAAMMDPLKPRMPVTQVHAKDESSLKTLLIVGLVANFILFVLLLLGLAILVSKLSAIGVLQQDKDREPDTTTTEEIEEDEGLDHLLVP